MDSIAIKFYSSADGDVRRTRLDTGADFNALSKQASAAFGVNGDIKWKDEDGDLVNVKCDGDWRECINYNGGGGAIKLHFFPHTTDGAPDRQQQQQQQQRSESPVEPFEIEVISPPPTTNEEEVLPDDSEFILAERVTEDTNTTKAAPASPLASFERAAAKDTTATAAATASATTATTTNTGTAAATAAAEESRKETTQLPLKTSAGVAKEEPAKRQPIHHGVECDASGTNPIVGTRYHLIHYNYDINDNEFAKLSEEHKELYEVVTHPGAEPVPFKTSTLPLVKDMIRTHRAAREELRRQQEEKDAKEAQRPIFAFIPPGDVIPPHEAAFGSVGPGVAQLQHALIAIGAMPPSAIRYRAGYFGPHTTEAIRRYKERHGIVSADNEFGTYTEAVRTQLLDEIDTLVNGQDQDQDQDQAEAHQPSKADTATTGATKADTATAGATKADTATAGATKEDNEAEEDNDDDDVHFLHALLAHLNGTPELQQKCQQRRQRQCGPDACRRKQAQAESTVVSSEEFQKARQDIAFKHSHAHAHTHAQGQESDYVVVEATAPTTAPADANANSNDEVQNTRTARTAGVGAGSKWAGELEKLASMGFADATENKRLLDLHNGALPFVVAGLL